MVSERYRCKRLTTLPTVTSFEYVCFTLTGRASTVVTLLVYRTGPVTDTFYKELSSLLEVVAVFAGDFNIHVEKHDDPEAIRLHELLTSFDCVQKVPAVPTHRAGGTLDLIITKSDQPVDSITVQPPDILSDHSLLSWKLPLDLPPPITINREIRRWKKLDVDEFRTALLQSELCNATKRPQSADEFFQQYHDVLQRLADQFAPVTKITIRRQRLAAWMDAECRQLRRTSRMLERRYRRTQQPSDRQKWVEHERRRHQVYRRKEQSYWSTLLSDHAGQPRKLWRSLNALLGKNTTRGSSSNCPSAQQLLDYFIEKVASVRRSTSGSEASTTLPSTSARLDHFTACSVDDIQKVIMAAPAKSCALDPVPTEVLKMFLQELLPYITSMCNASLLQGCLPQSQRHATVVPRLKKANADQTDVKNYRPISNLTFMSKVVERLVCQQLVAYLEQHDLLPRLQSAYRRFHSTETSILKLACDALLAADLGSVTLLGLLDLSAAFDTVDHHILINRLQLTFGIHGTVLKWVTSFITNRTQTVNFAGQQSTIVTVMCGVPQGSVLGPVLFLLYTADVTVIAQRHGFLAHSYADDTQIYFHDKASSVDTRLPRLKECISEIDRWMSSNRLCLNADKTQFIWLGTRQQLAKVQCHTIELEAATLSVATEVTCLGVTFDNELTFSKHVTSVVRRCFYHLRQLRTVRKSLTTEAAKTVVHALIASRIDYCNSVFYRISAANLQALQSVLNASARLVMRKRKFDHVTSTLHDDLHWLPVRQQIIYKICIIVYKCIHGTAPSYLTELCTPVAASTGRRHLRSAAHSDLLVPKTRTIGLPRPTDHAVLQSLDRVWNDLPPTLRVSPGTLRHFQGALKTILFCSAYGT